MEKISFKYRTELRIKKKICLFLVTLGLHCCTPTLVVAGGGYSSLVHGLLLAVASLVTEHGLRVRGLQWLQHAG